jgi:molybdopterin-guanine dinucleotide biosynthesis protein A
VSASAPLPCTGAILAGGAASRFDGRPKGLELVGGRRIVHRVAGALAQVSDALVMVANASDAASWLAGTPVVHDAVRDAGALGGLHAALSHAGGAVLAVAWDMPFVSPSLLGELRRLGERQASEVDAVVPEGTPEGAPEPLCAYYARSSLAAAGAALASGELRLGAFLGRLRVRRLPYARVLDWGDPRHLFFNVNTPAALLEANRLACPLDD